MFKRGDKVQFSIRDPITKERRVLSGWVTDLYPDPRLFPNTYTREGLEAVGISGRYYIKLSNPDLMLLEK